MEKENNNHSGFSRRNFIKVSATAGAGLLFSGNVLANSFSSISSKKRYAIIGTGSRCQMFLDAVFDLYKDNCEIVGLCDVNMGRLKFYQNYSKNKSGKTIPVYDAKDFDNMIKETKPDTVIVTTVDGYHHIYIVRAMELGCDVITEKPMTTDEIKCQQIIDAQQKTGKNVTVSFNYRYSPPRTQVKELLMTGTIGDILSVDFHWMLNTHHGADYFRRWHANKKYSGGLMVHKATHHFDLVNWWLSANPVTVYANGKRDFYTPQMAKRFGLSNYHERCHTCPEKNICGFELNLSANRRLKELYLDNEIHDGYYRDRCVFRPDIDIEDTMNVVVKYDNNATLCYSLNAFNSWEGYYIVFNGTKGRIEHKIEERIYVAGDGSVQGATKSGGTSTKVLPIRGIPYEIDVWEGTGGHGGGDSVMLDDLFSLNKKPDRYLRTADHIAGAYSILTGVAANNSIASGQEIKVEELVKNIGKPVYPPMPNSIDPVPMPDKRM